MENNNVTYLSDKLEIMFLSVPKKLETCTCISLQEQGNFYFFVLELLNKLLLKDISQNIEKFKNKYTTICEPSFFKKTLEENRTSLFIC